MCILVDDIEREYGHVSGIARICEDWNRARMEALETLPFERIHWALLEIDRRFELFAEYVLEYAGIERAA